MRPHTLIREARTAAGLTQAQLAARAGMAQPTIARLERPGSNPTVETLDRVLRATGHRLELGAPEWQTGADVTLIDQHLALSPAERLRDLERQAEKGRRLFMIGARRRGELA